MDTRRVAAIALAARDYPSFAAKLAEAVRWLELAARQGARLAVLPEALNRYRGDGPRHPRPLSLAESALDDWRRDCAPLLEAAVRLGIAVTVPVVIREAGGLVNAFFLVSAAGEVLGRYEKRMPTLGELEQGMRPGAVLPPIPWEGLRVGGGICFDLNFPEVFATQREAGADLFLCPSLTPGGTQVNAWAQQFQCPFVVAYPAWSKVVDRLGRDLAAGGQRHETLRFGFGAPVVAADLDFDEAVFHFDGNQEHIERILREDGSGARLVFDQDNVRFSLASRSPDRTLAELQARYGLEALDAYLARARAAVRSADTARI